jgi:chemotaxis protein MotA
VRTTTWLGLLLGVGFLALAVWSSGGTLSILVHRPALLLVLGGTFAAATLASSRQTARHALSAASRLLVSPSITTRQVSEALVEVARRARIDGLATVDPATVPIRDRFLLQGLQLLADGVEPERIEALLQRESELLSGRRAQAERLFRFMGRTALLLGLAGTSIELLALAPGLAGGSGPWSAVVASLAPSCDGLLLAGLVLLPLAGKVRSLDRYERLVRDQMLTGLLAIRLGQNPDYVRESLQAFDQTNG